MYVCFFSPTNSVTLVQRMCAGLKEGVELQSHTQPVNKSGAVSRILLDSMGY